MNQDMESQNNNIMTVTGIGRVTAIPDTAVIRLGVITTGDNLNIAQEENARITQMVFDALRQMGITNIRTFQYTIDRPFDFENGMRIYRGYEVRNMFEINTSMLDMVGGVIDTAVSAGANIVEQITFGIPEATNYYLEALNLALTNASAKARSIADKFGVPLNPIPIKIVENSRPPVPFTRTFLGEEFITTPIEPGIRDIEALVTLDFIY